MIVAERSGQAAGFAQQRSWMHFAASERCRHPKGRSVAQQPRERLDGDGPMWLADHQKAGAAVAARQEARSAVRSVDAKARKVGRLGQMLGSLYDQVDDLDEFGILK
jgi:hypothetical protein